MANSRLAYLFQRCTLKEATPAERRELIEMMADSQNENQVKELFEEYWEEYNPQQSMFTPDESETIFNKIIQTESLQANTGNYLKTLVLWKQIAAAAAILVFITFGGYFFLTKQTPAQKLSSEIKNDIPPGGNKAVLTLANGSQIILSEAGNGILTTQSNTSILKTKEGQIMYDASKSNSDLSSQLNAISTPRGGEYQIILPDGSKVWLNSASSLKFPVAFIGNERKVELSGEAYFEVTKNKKQPFKVNFNDTEVEVLGTHFNIMAYRDENSTKTTLLEGSVKVVKGQSNKIIIPGQQAVVHDEIRVVAVDTETAVAWKNGLISFREADIKTIMRQISRWYDVEVAYDGDVPELRFTGEISRNSPVSKVFELLSLSDIHLKLVGKRVIVYK